MSLETATGIDYKAKKRAQLAGIDFDKLAQLTNTTIESVLPAQGKDLILLVGRTGSGKSATLNYLLGSAMKMVRINGKRCLIVSPDSMEYAKIGHDGSETLHPKIVTIPSFPQLAFGDCPGFSDTKEDEGKIEEGLCARIGFPVIFNAAKSIKGLFIHVHYGDLEATRGEGFINLVRTLSAILANPVNMISLSASTAISPLVFIFTHVPAEEKAEDLVALITHEAEKINRAMDASAKVFLGVLRQLAELLGQSELVPSSVEKEQEIENVMEILLERAAGSVDTRVQELAGQLPAKQTAYLDNRARAGVVKLILAHQDHFYIIRGNQRDDKDRLLTHMARLATASPIDKTHFRLESYQNPEWMLWDDILQEIANDGAKYLNQLSTYPHKIREIKEHRNGYRIEQTEKVRQLQTLLDHPELTAEQLESMRRDIEEGYRSSLARLDRLIAEKETEKAVLETTLDGIDIAEPTRYHHRSVEPVDLSVSALQNIGSVLAGTVAGAASVFSWTIFTGMFLVLPWMAGNILAGAAKVVGLDKVSDALQTADNVMFITTFYPAFKARDLACRRSHSFVYQDIPFVEARPMPGIFMSHSAPTSVTRMGIEGGFGFLTDSIQENRIDGKYSATCVNRIGGALGASTPRVAEEAVWVELFVEKRLHPDYQPQIVLLQQQIVQVNARLAELRSEKQAAQDRYAHDSASLAMQADSKTQRENMIAHLKRELASYKARFDRLQERYLGLQYILLNATLTFVRQLPRYEMIAEMARVLQAKSEYVKVFILTYPASARLLAQNGAANSRQMVSVWGRKATPTVQPTYQMKSAKGKGSSIGAEFKLTDKLDGATWLGKLGVNERPVKGELARLAPHTRTRRQSALISILEKIAAGMYEGLSDHQYLVPKTRLAELPIDKDNSLYRDGDRILAEMLLEEINAGRSVRIEEGVFVMSKYMDGYHDFSALEGCIVGDERLNFSECLSRGFLPDWVEVEGQRVQIKGLMEILAAARLMADTDVLGGGANNAGYVIERDELGIPIGVRAVKIDPGASFNFDGTENGFYHSMHPAAPDTNPWKIDRRHIQQGNAQCHSGNPGTMPLLWSNLTKDQQTRFLVALRCGLALLRTSEWLNSMITNPAFQRTPLARELPDVRPYFEEFAAYIRQVEEAYGEELAALSQPTASMQEMLQAYLDRHAAETRSSAGAGSTGDRHERRAPLSYLFSPARTETDVRELLARIAEWEAILKIADSSERTRDLFGLESYAVHYSIGNCLFEAIAAAVPGVNGNEIRGRVVDFIRRNDELRARIISGAGTERVRTATGEVVYRDVDHYLELMATDRTWGTQIELASVARERRRPVVVLTPGNLYDFIVEEAAYADAEPIFINWINDNHYEPLAVPAGLDTREVVQRIRDHIEEQRQRRLRPR